MQLKAYGDCAAILQLSFEAIFPKCPGYDMGKKYAIWRDGGNAPTPAPWEVEPTKTEIRPLSGIPKEWIEAYTVGRFFSADKDEQATKSIMEKPVKFGIYSGDKLEGFVAATPVKDTLAVGHMLFFDVEHGRRLMSHVIDEARGGNLRYIQLSRMDGEQQRMMADFERRCFDADAPFTVELSEIEGHGHCADIEIVYSHIPSPQQGIGLSSYIPGGMVQSFAKEVGGGRRIAEEIKKSDVKIGRFEDGQWAGFIAASKMEGDKLNVNGIYVLPEKRGRGFGTELVMAVIQETKKNSLHGVDLNEMDLRLLGIMKGLEKHSTPALPFTVEIRTEESDGSPYCATVRV